MKRLLLVGILMYSCFMLHAQCPAFLGTGFENVPSIPFTDIGHDTSADVDDITSGNVADACDGNYLGGFDYVYIFTPTTTESHIISLTNQSSIWGGIHVYDGCPDTGNCIADATTSSSSDIITVSLTAGVTYFIIADIFASPDAYTYDFSIDVAPPPAANDECLTATPIACDDNLLGESTFASTDNGDVTGCFMGAGVWYEFTGIDAQVTLSVVPEAGFDHEIAVASSSDCSTFVNIDCEDTSGGGGTEEITFTSVSGTTYYFYVGHFSSASTFGSFDISVSCTTCFEPTFSLSDGSNDCPAGTAFNVDVTITDLGSATTLDIMYDDGSGPVTVPNVTSDITIGPFASGTNVDVTATDSADGTCSAMNSITTGGCPLLNDDCTGATTMMCGETLSGETTIGATGSSGTSCNGTIGNNVWYQFTGTGENTTVSVLGLAGYTVQLDIYESTDGTCGTISCNAASVDPLGGNPTEATFITTVGVVYFINVGAWTSSNGEGDFDISITCTSCVEATFSLSEGTNNCPTGTEFNVDVAITDLGSATTVDVTYDDGSGPVTVPNVTADITIGPFASGVNVDVTVADSADGTCAAMSSITTTEACPPINDDCATATTIACDDNLVGETTVASTDNGNATGCFIGAGVWYEFAGIDATVTLSVQPEAGFDPEIAVASSTDCVAFSNIDCEDAGGAGTLEEITFTAVAGTTYYFFVGHFNSATTFGAFDISVTCDFCVPATFSLANGTDNCPVGTEFNVDVVIPDLGSATTLDVTYDDGSGPVTVPNVTGDITIGPFGPGVTVDVTVADSADGTCSASNSITTIATCPPANDNCATATPIACDDNFVGETTAASTPNGDDTGCDMGAGVWYEFAGVDAQVTLSVQAGSGFDHEIAVASSTDCVTFTNVDCSDSGFGGGLEEITFTASAGTTYYFYVGHYSFPTTFGTFDISVTCDLCIPAPFTLSNGTNNCPTGTEFNVDVAIPSVGSATTLDVTYDDGSGPVTVPNVTGDISIGPFAPGATVDVTVADSADGTCSATSSITTLAVCPPANDECSSATPIACDDSFVGETTVNSTPNGDDTGCDMGAGVWYEFAGIDAEVTLTVQAGSGFDHEIAVASSTDCVTFTNVDCSDSGFGGGLEEITFTAVAGTTYYFYVGHYSFSTTYGTFDISVTCVLPPPANDDCSGAAILASNTTGSLIDQSFEGATASGMGSEICDVSATSTPSDVWFEIDTDADGGDLIVIVEPGPNSDVVVAIYEDCVSPLPEQCVDLGGNGGVETINFTALFKDKKGNESSSRDADYFVRVYEKVASGELFEIGAQGAALPIELGSFTAKAEKRGNLVEWTTLSEVNSDHVEVQSSPNGSTKWETIGKVASKGESTSRIDYELFDNNPYNVTYYRLNAVDKDGKSEMSSIINVKRSDVLGQLTLSPNPARSNITVQTASQSEDLGTISIIDMTGKVVMRRSQNLIKGLNSINVELDELSPGLYLFSLQTGNEIQVEKFVKQ